MKVTGKGFNKGLNMQMTERGLGRHLVLTASICVLAYIEAS